MFVICGLGNPGKKYQGTRHNVGFSFIDEIINKYKFMCTIELPIIKEIGNRQSKKFTECSSVIFFLKFNIIN